MENASDLKLADEIIIAAFKQQNIIRYQYWK